jgi:hypothetical protein
VYMAVLENPCARVFPKFITCAKTCAKLVRTRRARHFQNTCKSMVLSLRVTFRRACTKLAPDLRRRARGAPKSSLPAPREHRDEGGFTNAAI